MVSLYKQIISILGAREMAQHLRELFFKRTGNQFLGSILGSTQLPAIIDPGDPMHSCVFYLYPDILA